MFFHHPSTVVFIAAMYHHIPYFNIPRGPDKKGQPDKSNSRMKIMRISITRILLFDLLPSSILVFLSMKSSHRSYPVLFLRPMTNIIRQWPKILPQNVLEYIPDFIIGYTGPFGFGCGKFVEFICGYLLLCVSTSPGSSNDGSGIKKLWPPPKAFWLGDFPGVYSMILVMLFSFLVNVVLGIWSNITGSRGDHDGLLKMANRSSERHLTLKEHIKWMLLALGNAFCEEMISRGLFYSEFLNCNLTKNEANLLQATSFGIWHYHGVPSGISGVLLTFIYGLFMGLLCNYGNGLYLPIIAHAIADYFLFTVVLQKKKKTT